MNNPYLDEIARSEKPKTGNPYLDELEAKERPKVKGSIGTKPLPGSLNDNAPMDPFAATIEQNGKPVAQSNVMDIRNRKVVESVAMMAPGVPIIGAQAPKVVKASGTPKSPAEALGLPGIAPYQAPKVQQPKPLTRQQIIERDPGKKPGQMARELSKKAQGAPRIVTIPSPVGPIEIETASIGITARIPGVGEVQAPNQAALKIKIDQAVANQLAQNETQRLSPNVDPFELKDVLPSGQRYMNDRDKYAAIMQDIEGVMGGLVGGLKALNPMNWVTQGAEAAGVQVPDWLKTIQSLGPEVSGRLISGSLTSPAYIGAKMNVLQSDQFSPEEKFETGLGLLLMAATSSATPFGPSVIDDLLKLGKGSAAFDDALKALEAKAGKPIKTEVEKVFAQFQPKELEGYVSPPTLKDAGVPIKAKSKAVKPETSTANVPKDAPKIDTSRPRVDNIGMSPPVKTESTAARSVPTEGQSLSNRATDIVKKRIGEPEYVGVPRETVKQWAEAAVKKGYHEPDRAQQIAKEVIEGTKKSLDKEETIGLASALDGLDKQWDDVSRQLEAKAEKGGDIELSTRLEDIRQKIVDITGAGNKSGAEWGRSGIARQAMMKSDGSFAGIIARRQKIVNRELTANEVVAAKREAAELTKVQEAQAARIRQLEDQLAQQQLSGHAGGSKLPKERAERVEAKIKDVSERLKLKWKESKPTTSIHSSVLFGADVAAEQVVRVAKIAPEILELAKLHAEKGLIKLADNTSAVVNHLRSLGISDIEENDVAAVLAGRIRGEGKDRAMTTYAALREEASSAFSQASKERAERLKLVAQKETETKRLARSVQRDIDMTLLKKEREEIAAEYKAARQAERDFWKEVAEAQREFDKAKRKAASLTRAESVRRWRASVPVKRAGALDRIEALQEKLDFYHESGSVLGSKSDLPEKPDDILLSLRVQEASLRRQMSQVEHKMRQAEAAKNKTIVEKLIDLPTHQIPGTLRNFLAMGDMSWSGIQGSLVFFMNPKAWGKGALAGGRALFSKNKTFIEAMEKLRESGTIDKIIASGVDLPGLQPGHADEFFADTFADALPVYGNIRKGSQQAYDAAATVTRGVLVETWIKALEASGRPLDETALKVLGEAANTLTGKASGTGGRLVSSLPAAGKTLFAPSWWLSQFQGMTGKPLRDALVYGAKTKDWRLAKLMSKEYAKIAGIAYGSLLATAEVLKQAKDAGLTDWEIETNVQSKDFGKIWTERSGKKMSVDFLPPQLSAPVRFSAQAILGTKDKDGKVKSGAYNRQQLLGSTFEGKYGPGFRIGFGMLDSINATNNPNKETGKPKYPFGVNTDPRSAEGWKNLAGQTLPPIAWQQGYKGLTESNLSPTEKAVLFFLSAVGRGPNIYEKKN